MRTTQEVFDLAFSCEEYSKYAPKSFINRDDVGTPYMCTSIDRMYQCETITYAESEEAMIEIATYLHLLSSVCTIKNNPFSILLNALSNVLHSEGVENIMVINAMVCEAIYKDWKNRPKTAESVSELAKKLANK